MNGIRLPLHSERRFSRSFQSDEHRMGSEVSRFMDGSASITAPELKREWPGWTQGMRMDFCQSSEWLHEQADYPEMLRFIMQHGCPEHWSGIALSVASLLPRDEAFETLVRALGNTEPGHTANICQAIARTKHPDAEITLRGQLAALWEHPALWDNDDFSNWIAFDATSCITHLIELGVSPSDFAAQVRKLSEHVCSGNRVSCRNFLSKYYPWLA